MNKKQTLQQLIVFALFILAWKIFIFVLDIKEFILPQPETVFVAYLSMISSYLFLKHTAITVIEILAGFILGSLIGIFWGYIIGKSDAIEKILSPYLIALQVIPVIAIAPLLIIWFGFGIESKIIICALIVFFPVLINTISGINTVDEKKVDLFRTLGASKLQVFCKLELQSAAPTLFAGFKIGITLAVIGAIVGEFVGSSSGLGYLIIQGTGLMNMPKVFAVLVQLAIVGLVLYSAISHLEKISLPWYFLKNKQTN